MYPLNQFHCILLNQGGTLTVSNISRINQWVFPWVFPRQKIRAMENSEAATCWAREGARLGGLCMILHGPPKSPVILVGLLQLHLGVNPKIWENPPFYPMFFLGFGTIIFTIHFGYPYFWKHPVIEGYSPPCGPRIRQASFWRNESFFGAEKQSWRGHWKVGPCEKWKKYRKFRPSCLGYIGDYTTQLYVDYNKPL